MFTFDHVVYFCLRVTPHESTCLPSPRYQKHLSWARDVLLAQGLEEEVVNQILQRLCQPMEPGLREENGDDDCPASPHRGEETGARAGIPQDVASEQAGTVGQQGQASASWSPEDQGEQDSRCPQAKRPRSQVDGGFDPLSELYPQAPQQIDSAALSTVRCPRHDDLLVDCGCRLEDSVLETLTLQRDRQTEAGRQGADRGYEYVLVMEEKNSVVKVQCNYQVKSFNTFSHKLFLTRWPNQENL